MDAVLRFSRLVAGARGPVDILPSFVAAIGDANWADAVVALELRAPDGFCVVAGRNVPPEALKLNVDVEDLLAEAGPATRRACGDRFARAHTIPLVSGGDLYGALVLLFASDAPIASGDLRIVEGLADLAGIALGKAAQYERLERTIGEIRTSREALAHATKLRSLGEMAAGIAHDLKNILAPLSLHVQFLRRVVPTDNPDVVTTLEDMQRVLRRGVETIDRLRQFSRQSPESVLQTADLEHAAHEAVEISRPRMRSATKRVDVTERYVDAPAVRAAPAELINAIVNLLINAADAIGDEGHVAVETGTSDGGAWVAVRDDGPGVPPEHRGRVFEPFFTTKGEAGTGLGLAMVYAFVQRHAGRVTLESEAGKGSRFVLWFPAVAARDVDRP